jgi:hypothetical protein
MWLKISPCGDGSEWDVDESHTRLHEDILLEEQIGKCGVADSAGALGLYLLDNEKQQRLKESIPSITEPTDLYLLKREKMDWRKFHRQNGYGPWHQRLMNCKNQIIKQTNPILQRTGEVGRL